MFKGIARMLLSLSVTLCQGSCFKVLYERSKRLATFAEEQSAKLQSELGENHAKRAIVENQRTEVFDKKTWS